MKPSTLPALVLALATASCSSTEANFNTRFAPGFSPARHVVSVFGVYKDGQMSSEAWTSLAPQVSASLGSARCPAGYVDQASSPANPLWAAVDDYTRSNGPTDDLLAQLAPAAEGDLVLVLTVAGRVPVEEKTHLPDETPQSPSMPGGSRGGMSGMGAGAAMRHAPGKPAGSKDALDLAALLFSVSEKRSVGQVSLEYTGSHFDEAVTKFTAKLRESLPGAACAGWSWDGKVDVERVRKLGEP